MLRFKKQFAFLFGVIALITYVSVRYFPVEKEVTPVIQTQKEETHMQVYLMDSDQTLVPISIPVSEELSEEDKVTMMLGYMSGKQSIKGFQPLFSKAVVPASITIDDGVIAVDFDDALQNYTAENELRVLEGLTWGMTQFHDVERVKLMQHGETLTKMPKANTPIPEILNRSIGINHFETGATSLHDSDALTVFYTKKITGNTYMVPKSKRYTATKQTIEQKVQVIAEDIAVSSTLTQPLTAHQIQIEGIHVKNKSIQVSLNKNILGADKTVKQDVYDSLVLSLLSLDGITSAQVLVDDVVVSISNEDQPVSLQDITYNIVKF